MMTTAEEVGGVADEVEVAVEVEVELAVAVEVMNLRQWIALHVGLSSGCGNGKPRR